MHKTTDCTVAKARWLWSMSQTLLSVSMLWVVAYATALHAAQPQKIDPRRSLGRSRSRMRWTKRIGKASSIAISSPAT